MKHMRKWILALLVGLAMVLPVRGEEETSLLVWLPVGEERTVPAFYLGALPEGVEPGQTELEALMPDKAGRLRSVIRNTYPCMEDIRDIEDSANAWLLASGQEEIRELQMEEVLSATRQAIASILQDDTTEDMPEGNEQLLCNFFMQLPGEPARSHFLTEQILDEIRCGEVWEPDGSCTVTVSGTVSWALPQGNWTLTLFCGDAQESLTPEPGGFFQAVFPGLEVSHNVTVILQGAQKLDDVFFFAEDGLYLGYDGGSVPARLEKNLLPERTLTITRKTPWEEPLSGIRFSVYPAEQTVLPTEAVPGEGDLTAYACEEKRIALLTTDERGIAAFNFSANGWPDGVYLVVEETNPAVLEPAAPFYVRVPGEKGKATVTVLLETEPEAAPEVWVEQPEPEGRTLLCSIPAGLGGGDYYRVETTLEPGASLVEKSVEVGLSGGGTEKPLTETLHYTLSPAEEGFSLSLTADGRAAAGDMENLQIRYRTRQTATGEGQEGTGSVRVSYRNGAGVSYVTDAAQESTEAVPMPEETTAETGTAVEQTVNPKLSSRAGLGWRLGLPGLAAVAAICVSCRFLDGSRGGRYNKAKRKKEG